MKKLGIKRFYADTKLTVHEYATIKNIDLIDMGQIKHRIKFWVDDFSFGLLPCFTKSAFFNRFAIFHETCRQRPKAFAWTDGPFTQQDFILMLNKTAGNDSGILVVNGVALITNKAKPIVALGYSMRNGGAAVTTEFHGIKALACD